MYSIYGPAYAALVSIWHGRTAVIFLPYSQLTLTDIQASQSSNTINLGFNCGIASIEHRQPIAIAILGCHRR
jgi:hypothetical protein